MTAAPEPPAPSRRTLLRTGGTAAWAAPVIVVASAAPVFAGSLQAPADFLLSSTADASGQRVDHSGTILKTGGTAPSDGGILTVTARITGAAWIGEPTDPFNGTQPLEYWSGFSASHPDAQTIQANWTLSGELPPGTTYPIPPFFSLVSTAGPYAGTITTQFAPTRPGGVSNPSIASFTSPDPDPPLSGG